MMKFTMDAKKLKTLIDKAMTAINKKSTLAALKRVYFQVDTNKTIKIRGTNMEHFVEVRSDQVKNTSSGIIAIDIDDVKIIGKMSGELTLEDGGSNGTVNLKCGKKIVSIPKYDGNDITFPIMDDTETLILTASEWWLLETITSLYPFTTEDNQRIMCEVFNFNTLKERVEALDNCKIGIKSISDRRATIITKEQNGNDSVKLHRMCVPVFKKIMKSNTCEDVKIFQDKKYVRVEGKTFTYITRRIEGCYYDIEPFLNVDYKYTFNADKEDMLSAMQYNHSLAGQEKLRTILHAENGKLFSYLSTSKYEIFDELKSENNNMNEELYIGFNHCLIMDALNIIDTDNPVFMVNNAKSPMFIKGNEYSFILLPALISDEYCKKMKTYMREHNIA